jgi:hypothetical protein
VLNSSKVVLVGFISCVTTRADRAGIVHLTSVCLVVVV